MIHIHVPDGVLPLWLWLSGFVLIFIYIIILSFNFKKSGLNKKLPLVGVLSALMLVAMSIEVLPIAYHVNLVSLTGIILGPWLAVLSIFIVNLILALLGHGGITVVGLNTILLSIAAILTYFIFKFLLKTTKRLFLSTFIATFIALFITAWSAIGLIYIGTNDLSYLNHEHEHSCISHDCDHEEHDHNHSKEHDAHEKAEFNIKKFIIAILTLGISGWTLEAFITAFIIKYIYKIKPDIIMTNRQLEVDLAEKE